VWLVPSSAFAKLALHAHRFDLDPTRISLADLQTRLALDRSRGSTPKAMNFPLIIHSFTFPAYRICILNALEK
jgi:hypothetical protein